MIRQYEVTLIIDNPFYPATPAKPDVVVKVQADGRKDSLHKAVKNSGLSWGSIRDYTIREVG